METACAQVTIADLFAGAGGFSLGFAQVGCHVALAVEQDTWACDTFRHNHPETRVLQRDLRSIADDDLAALLPSGVDMLLGGPPCQGFSIANLSAGDPNDPRNTLFMEMVRAASLWRPPIIVMENVAGLLARKTASGQQVIDVICEEFSALGYLVDYRILRAVDFGVPQLRPRLFVIACLDSLPEAFPSPTHLSSYDVRQDSLFGEECLPYTPTLWDAISDLPVLNAGQGSDEASYTSPPLTDYQRRLRSGSEVLHNHVAMNHSKRMVDRFASMKWGDSISDVPEEHQPRKRGNARLFSDRAFDQNNRRMHPDRPCHTIPASFYANFVHPYQHRNFTPREGARIQSFPDTYRFMGKPTVVSQKLLAREQRHSELHLCQYNQIGNAVPPMLARALATHLLDVAPSLRERGIYASAR